MTLYYCVTCGAVFAFNMSDIRKHGLKDPSERSCGVCHCEVLLPVGEVTTNDT